MNLPATHPIWLWIYFGIMGTVSLILLALILWTRLVIISKKGKDSAGRMITLGIVLLFCSGWMACGIAGPPGNLLSKDISSHNQIAATWASIASMAFAVIGWICILIGYKLILKKKNNSNNNQQILNKNF
ncbi:MAG: hypothetical protein M1479_03370 [Actinobacteria bacterium]|nr:hypothetical protein [Actinomycetota bacterium]